MQTTTIGALLEHHIHPLNGSRKDYDPLMNLIGDAQVVLLGEATHGTHEFYQARAEITKRLITEKGFCAVAVEADWPDTYRINQYVHGTGGVLDALAGFKRFPQWMWRNTDVLRFISWLRAYNDPLPALAKVGFYGMDLYSLNTSIQVVLEYLAKVDPAAARRARFRYGCFDDYGEDMQSYGYASSFGMRSSCEDAVVEALVELRRKAVEYGSHGDAATEAFFSAEQNARLIKNAEAYYREMFHGRVSSWNLRDRHMVETLEALLAHLRETHTPTKIVVWAHNSHLGDARATDMGQAGELNVGQLMRQHHGQAAVLVGFATNSGTVTAASDWGARAERKQVRPALAGSYEALFHQAAHERFLIPLREQNEVTHFLQTARLERAIGVIYRPDTERVSHYFRARLPEQFDALLYYDKTQALEPLDRTPEWETGEVAETFPTGM